MYPDIVGTENLNYIAIDDTLLFMSFSLKKKSVFEKQSHRGRKKKKEIDNDIFPSAGSWLE